MSDIRSVEDAGRRKKGERRTPRAVAERRDDPSDGEMTARGFDVRIRRSFCGGRSGALSSLPGAKA